MIASPWGNGSYMKDFLLNAKHSDGKVRSNLQRTIDIYGCKPYMQPRP
jgi:hypothetical protein